MLAAREVFPVRSRELCKEQNGAKRNGSRRVDGLSRFARRRLGLNPSPSHRSAAHGLLYRAEEHDVHQLTIIKALKKNGNEQRPVLFAFEGECENTGENINQQETDEEKYGAQQIGGSGLNCG